MSVTLTLEDDLDISRGDILVRPNNQPQIEQDLEATLCWMNARPLQTNAKLVLRHTTKECRVTVKSILYKIDINALRRIESVSELQMNDIARVRLRSSQPLLFDSFKRNRHTGSIILIDESTNETVAAGMIL